MQKFPVTFSRNPVTVLILVVIPLVVTAIFLLPLLLLPRIPDWAVLVLSFALMGSSIACVLLAIKKWGAVKAEVAMDDAGIAIKLLNRSPFYPRRQYTGSWEGLENVSTNLDPQHNKRFYLVRFRQPAVTVSLMPDDIADADSETPFGEALLRYVSGYNTAHQAQPETLIRQRGFYDTWWAKGLTIMACLMIGAALIMRFTSPGRVSIWQLIQVLSFGILWLSAFYINRRRRKT